MAVPTKETHETMYIVDQRLADAGESLFQGTCDSVGYHTLKWKKAYPGT